MNKSKFLKKSLAMLLALMLVLAMIPLSASAAPSSAFAVEAKNGQNATPEKTADGWHLYFEEYYTDPSVVFEVATSGETVEFVNEDGETKSYDGTPVALPTDDETGAPAPLKIKVTNNGETTNHTITWAMVNADSEVSVSRATLGTIEADSIDNEAHTIHFTVPFGYDEKNTVGSAVLTVDGGTAATVPALEGKIKTNETAGQAVTVNVTPEDSGASVPYTITAEEETGLTAVSIGDFKGEFVLKDTDPDKGYETGTIRFTVPVGTSFAEDLPITFEVGSSFTTAYLGTNSGVSYTSNTEISSGDKKSFANLASGTAEYLTIVNADGYREYTLDIVEDAQDVGITAAYVNLDGDATDYDATVDGENINVVVPADADLTKDITVNFIGPKKTSTDPANKSPQILPMPGVTATGNGKFDTNGEASLIFSSYSSPIRLQLQSADDVIYGYYTLTITKAEAPQKNPQVTSAKVVLWPDTDAEYTTTGGIDHTANTITFEVPYSTTTDDLANKANFAFAKTSQTHWDPAFDQTSLTIGNGGKIGVKSNDTDDAKEYTIVFKRLPAQTGKTISNFQLSTANNENLKAYNNNKNYNVTVSGKELQVTMPNSQTGNLYPSFELSQGAALYKIAGTAAHAKETAVSAFVKVNDYNATTGAYGSELTASDYADGFVYIVVDETLAYEIARAQDTTPSGDLVDKNLDYISNEYTNNYVQYTLKVTKQDKTGHTLTAISADDGKVIGTFQTNNKTVIDLSVPNSYVADNANISSTGVSFFFDYTTSEGATLNLTNSASVHFEAVSGGRKQFVNNTLSTLPASWTGVNTTNNPGFKIVKQANDTYALYYGPNASDGLWRSVAGETVTSPVVTMSVVAEDGSVTPYTIGKITVRDAETGASLTSAKVNDVQASISESAQTVSATLNYGANLGQVTLDLEADYMATIQVQEGTNTPALYDASKKYDFTKGGKIIVTSESGGDSTDYTLKLTTGDMFSDVADDQWYYDYVLEAAELGIVKGNPDGTFKPNDKVTRADFALMTVRMLGVDEDGLKFTTTAFTDVNDETYNAAAIQYCAEKGLIGGDGDGKFRPNDSITRQEAAKIIAEALELTETDDELFTDDSLIHEWAEDYVYQCKAAGIFGGDAGTGNFRPTDAISRAETAKIMVVAYNNK